MFFSTSEHPTIAILPLPLPTHNLGPSTFLPMSNMSRRLHSYSILKKWLMKCTDQRSRYHEVQSTHRNFTSVRCFKVDSIYCKLKLLVVLDVYAVLHAKLSVSLPICLIMQNCRLASFFQMRPFLFPLAEKFLPPILFAIKILSILHFLHFLSHFLLLRVRASAAEFFEPSGRLILLFRRR